MNSTDYPDTDESQVSATNELRDQLRGLARGYLNQGVRLQELDYQPE